MKENFWNFAGNVVLGATLVFCFAAADWPQFRGDNANGVSQSEIKGPTTWTADENIVRKAIAPGFGSSSPAMKGDRIYLTGYYGYGTDASDAGDLEKMMYRVACYNRQDGTVLWHREMKAAELEACFQEWIARTSAGKRPDPRRRR